MSWLRKVLRIEPGVSLVWWLVERLWSIVTNWTLLGGLFGGAIMTYYSVATEWIAITGPAVVAGIGIGTACIISLVVSRTRLWTAQRAVEQANRRYINARAALSAVNPIDIVYTNQRIDVRDITRPLTDSVRGKTFVGCQIVGPVNIRLSGTTNLANPAGVRCESIYLDNNVEPTNVIWCIDCDFRNCELFNVTFLVPPADFERFTVQILTNWITKNPHNYTEFDPRNGKMLTRDEPELPFQLPQAEKPQGQ